MFPGAPQTPQLSKSERKLCKVYKNLNENDRETLMAFAVFLNQRDMVSEDVVEIGLQKPLDIVPAEKESVVKGIKRLKASYHMIENDDLLHEVSALMTEHVMQGVAAAEVIAKVEAVFLKYYEDYKQSFLNTK